MEARGVVDLELDDVVDLGELGVVARELDGVGVDVAAPDLVLAVELVVHRLVRRVEPEHFIERGPVLGGKAAVEARRTVARDERRLDGDSARA